MSGGADNADYRRGDSLGALSLQPFSVMTGFDSFSGPITPLRWHCPLQADADRHGPFPARQSL